MKTTKYMKVYENFDKGEDDNEGESQQDTIKKIWEVIDSGDFFCIISSYNPGNGPDILAEEYEQLKNDIRKLKYTCLEQSCGYNYSDGNGQTSVMRKSLFVPFMHYQELLSLGKKYNQEIIAFGGNGEISVVRVSDEKVVMDMKTEDMKLAWNLLLVNPRNIPW